MTMKRFTIFKSGYHKQANGNVLGSGVKVPSYGVTVRSTSGARDYVFMTKQGRDYAIRKFKAAKNFKSLSYFVNGPKNWRI